MSDWNPHDYLKRIVHDFVFYRRSTIADTTWFENQKHNNHLVPHVEAKLDAIISMFDRYHRTVHDFQGPRDRGVDVIVKYGSEDEAVVEEFRYIGFQVKSFAEIGKDGWLTKLKAQCFEALTRGLADYYVLFCTNSAKHKDALRAAAAEIVEMPGVTVVSPEFAYTFLHLSDYQLAAHLKAKLSRDDAVFREAAESVSDLTPSEAAILIELLSLFFLEGEQVISVEQLRNSSFVIQAYRVLPDIEREFYFESSDSQGRRYSRTHLRERSIEERFDEDFSYLEGSSIETGSYDSQVMPPTKDYRAIQAVMLDAVVRYDMTLDDVREYILNALMEENVKKALEFVAKYERSAGKAARRPPTA